MRQAARLCLPLVACVACDAAAEDVFVVLVNIKLHQHHLARGYLRRLVVFLHLRNDVTVSAVDAKRSAHEIHYGE